MRLLLPSIRRLPQIEGNKPTRKAFKRYPIDYFHINIAEVRSALALREQVLDFAVDAQGLDAAALHERFRATF